MRTLSRQRDAAELLRRLGTVRSSSVARWGRMSAHQMVCHLGDSFRMAIGEKPVAHWLEKRNEVPSWDFFIDREMLADTIEVAVTWDRIDEMRADSFQSIRPGSSPGR